MAHCKVLAPSRFQGGRWGGSELVLETARQFRKELSSEITKYLSRCEWGMVSNVLPHATQCNYSSQAPNCHSGVIFSHTRLAMVTAQWLLWWGDRCEAHIPRHQRPAGLAEPGAEQDAGLLLQRLDLASLYAHTNCGVHWHVSSALVLVSHWDWGHCLSLGLKVR